VTLVAGLISALSVAVAAGDCTAPLTVFLEANEALVVAIVRGSLLVILETECAYSF
jgi:hypothetical protein